MTKLSDHYRIFLKAHHLPSDGSPRQATIEKATLETLHPRAGQEIKAIVISFVNKPHKLILNQSNANRLYTICGDDTDKWPGIVINLRRSTWGSKPTIIIENAATNGKGPNRE